MDGTSKASGGFSIAVGIILLVVVGSFTLFITDIRPEPVRGCSTFADPIRVMVGSAEFQIPADLQPDFENNIGDEKVPEHMLDSSGKSGYCQTNNHAPFRVKTIAFNPQGAGYSKAIQKKYGYHYFPNIDFHLAYSADSSLVSYCTINGDKLRELSGWMPDSRYPSMLTTSDSIADYYKSPKLTLFGLPVIVECSRSGGELGSLCRVDHPYHPLTQDITIMYFQFLDTEIPKKDWEAALKEGEIIIKSIMIKPIKNYDPSVCSQILKGE